MIPYPLDPTLHAAPPPPAELGDGFTPAPETAEHSGERLIDFVGCGLDQAPSQF